MTNYPVINITSQYCGKIITNVTLWCLRNFKCYHMSPQCRHGRVSAQDKLSWEYNSYVISQFKISKVG